MKVYKKIAKTFLSVLFCIALVTLSGCGIANRIVDHFVEPTSVTIDGVTYRSEFYGDLYPMFYQVGDVGMETLQQEIVYEDGSRQYRRVDFEGHNWVHCYTGKYISGMVYCAESEWEQTKSYYENPENFDYYFGHSEDNVLIPEIDYQKFDELKAFEKENQHNPFDVFYEENEKDRTRRIPESEFKDSFTFLKESKDGYFHTINCGYFIYEDKLFLLFYHDGGRTNGGIEEVVAMEVPDELGQYFIELSKKYHP